jgi:hypothetical protein
MRKKILLFTLLFAFLVTAFFLIKRKRLLEYYSVTKNIIRVNSELENASIRLEFLFEGKKGKGDSLPFSLADKSRVVLPDYYGKQGFAFYINEKRWYANVGYFKFRKWYKFKGTLYLKKLSNEQCIAQFDLYHDGEHGKTIDTLSLSQ